MKTKFVKIDQSNIIKNYMYGYCFYNTSWWEPGTYTYKVTEKVGHSEDYEYDNSEYIIKFEVTKQEGKLKVNQTLTKDGLNSDAILFNNKTDKYEEKGQDVTDNPEKPDSEAEQDSQEKTDDVKKPEKTENPENSEKPEEPDKQDNSKEPYIPADNKNNEKKIRMKIKKKKQI